jgi:hypothetical protein
MNTEVPSLSSPRQHSAALANCSRRLRYADLWQAMRIVDMSYHAHLIERSDDVCLHRAAYSAGVR